MRRYCKDVDITNIKFIERCIYLWIDDKKNRRDVQRFLVHYCDLTYAEIKEASSCEDYWFIPKAIERIAIDVQNRILLRSLELPPIIFVYKYDDVCLKWREIGIQKPIHQIFDYIAVEGCKPLFNAKIGPYQMASIKGRGQEKGARAIYKWLQLDEKKTKYYAQADVRQCYPSIDHDNIKKMFARDLKNPTLLWLVEQLIDAFPKGLSIGSYFSQYACNYYLSHAYHYAEEYLAKTRKRRDGTIERIRLIYHQLYYMDDVLFLGSSRKDIRKAMELFIGYAASELQLEIKPNWRIEATDYIDKNGIRKGTFIDMMGYRIYRDHITIRRRTFKRINRTVIRSERKIKSGQTISLETARRIVSFCGKLKHSDAHDYCRNHRVGKIKAVAQAIVSDHDRKKAEDVERRRKEYEDRKGILAERTGGIDRKCLTGWTKRSLDPKKYQETECPF